MPEVESDPLPPTEAAKARRDARRKQRSLEKRLAQMASIYRRNKTFFAELERDPAYSRELHRLTARISQEKALEWNMNKKSITWGLAHKRVITFDVEVQLEKRFGKSIADIRSDLGKLASYRHWLVILGENGEYGLWADVCRDIDRCDKLKAEGIQIMEPAKPVQLNARQVNESVARQNAEFQKIQAEFLGDAPRKPSGTASFDFLSEVDRQANLSGYGGKPKKPRRNGQSWRREK